MKSFDSNNLKEYCFILEHSLKHNNRSDIDGLYLFIELKIIREIIHVKNDTLIDILNYIKRIDSFPNVFIAYRIMLIIPKSVALAKKSFSKLKLIKSYLRSTMCQERLNELALILIEKEMLKKIVYNKLINKFASLKVRKINFQ